MGLDWVIQPLPDEVHTDNYDDTDYEYSWRFRANKLKMSDVPEFLINEAHKDMTPWEMTELSDTLNQEVTTNTEDYTDEEVKMIEQATEWLEYWADKDKCVYASY